MQDSVLLGESLWRIGLCVLGRSQELRGGLKWWASLPRETGAECENPRGGFLVLFPCLASGDPSMMLTPASKGAFQLQPCAGGNRRGPPGGTQNFTFGGEGARLLTGLRMRGKCSGLDSFARGGLSGNPDMQGNLLLSGVPGAI